MKINKFTLVELLVVIAIIAMLAAMLLPALKNAKAVGIEAVCISNQRNIYIAELLYEKDNTVLSFDYTRAVGTAQSAHLFTKDVMATYLAYSTDKKKPRSREDSVLFCPSTPRELRKKSFYGSTSYPRYVMQYHSGGSPVVSTILKMAARKSNLKSPDMYIFNFEAKSNWATNGLNPNASFSAVYYQWQYSWHERNVTASFYDGHAERDKKFSFEGAKPPFYGTKFWSVLP